MTAGSTDDHRRRIRFSLGQLLSLTTLVALGVALIVVYREYLELSEKKERLLALSSRLIIKDQDELQFTQFPRVADDFASWETYVPSGEPFELRFGVGEMSQASMPEEFERFALQPGRHRITLRSADSFDEDYHFTIFVDGKVVMDRTLGRKWMPDGWQQASGLSIPTNSDGQRFDIHQLKARIYTPRVNYGTRSYFNGQGDDWVSNPSYRLWIDQADQTYAPPSPFLGFKNQPQYRGIGLRDGLRYRTNRSRPYPWTFLRPKSQSNEPALTIIPEFLAGDQVLLSDDDQAFQAWKVRNAPTGRDALSWKRTPNQTAYSAFLHADVEGVAAVRPVVELRWDATRPDDVGLRLPKVAANADLTMLRLRITGPEHLWRLIDAGPKQLDVRKDFASEEASAENPALIELENAPSDSYRLRWRTDIAKPLQMLDRGKNAIAAFRGVDRFQGLPLTFEAELPTASNPVVRIAQANNLPGDQKIAIPGGPIIEEVQITLDASTDRWLWLRAVELEPAK